MTAVSMVVVDDGDGIKRGGRQQPMRSHFYAPGFGERRQSIIVSILGGTLELANQRHCPDADRISCL